MTRLTAQKLLEAIGDGEIKGDPEREIEGFAPPEIASEKQATFFFKLPDTKTLKSIKASVVILPFFSGVEDPNKTFIMVKNPLFAMTSLLSLVSKPLFEKGGISPLAYVSAEADIDEDVTIYPFVFVDKEAYIAKGSVIMPHVFIGKKAKIGREVVIFPCAVIYPETVIKDKVIIHAGAVVGSDGFGYVELNGKRIKIPQIGRVRVENEVEIGANTCIDRATLGETVIGEGTKIDNLVQIGHNTSIGKNCAFAGQVGISGSVKIGDRVLMGGQAGIADHINIEDDAKIAAKAGIMSNVQKGEIVSGAPAMSISKWRRVQASLMRLPELSRRIRRLERILEHIQGGRL